MANTLSASKSGASGLLRLFFGRKAPFHAGSGPVAFSLLRFSGDSSLVSGLFLSLFLSESQVPPVRAAYKRQNFTAAIELSC